MAKTERDDGTGAKIARGVLAGLVAGVAASFVVDGFQAGVNALAPSTKAEGEPATEQAADALGEAVVGREVATADKPLAGQAVHYAFGAVLGAAYGVAAEFRPTVTQGGGVPFGLVAATAFDESAVPALGLGEPPWRAGWVAAAYGYASHAVFGAVLELVRRQTAETLRPN